MRMNGKRQTSILAGALDELSDIIRGHGSAAFAGEHIGVRLSFALQPAQRTKLDSAILPSFSWRLVSFPQTRKAIRRRTRELRLTEQSALGKQETIPARARGTKSTAAGQLFARKNDTRGRARDPL